MKINKKILFLLCSILLFYGISFAHPFYVSICQVDFNNTNKSLEISLKIFADDLIVGLEHIGASKLYLGEKKENHETDDFILSYLKSTLSFVVNEKAKPYSYIGKEIDNDVVWIYIEIIEISILKKIEISSSLLTEVLETQSNIIQVNNGSGIKSLLLNKKNQKGIIKF